MTMYDVSTLRTFFHPRSGGVVVTLDLVRVEAPTPYLELLRGINGRNTVVWRGSNEAAGNDQFAFFLKTLKAI